MTEGVENASRAEEPVGGGEETLSPTVSIKVKRALFSFASHQEWVNKAQSRYANCGVRQGHYITMDARGHVMHMGKCFMEAEKQGSYPVTVYELQTNWPEGA